MFGPILYAMIFIGVLMIVEGIYLLIFGKTHSRESSVNRRLQLLEKGGDREEVLVQLRKERARQRPEQVLKTLERRIIQLTTAWPLWSSEKNARR